MVHREQAKKYENNFLVYDCETYHFIRKKTLPHTSLFISQIENDYYKNLTEADSRSKIDMELYFSEFEFKSNTSKFP